MQANVDANSCLLVPSSHDIEHTDLSNLVASNLPLTYLRSITIAIEVSKTIMLFSRHLYLKIRPAAKFTTAAQVT